VLRRIFGPKTDEVAGEWRELHNEELNDLYSSPNIFRVIKSRRMRWAGHVASTGNRKVCTGFWWGKMRERDNLEVPGVDGRINSDGSSGSGMWGRKLDSVGSGYGQVVGTCECGNDPLGSIKCGKFPN
jgi:hypothetical protein